MHSDVQPDDEIDLRAIWNVLWSEKWFIVVVAIVFTLISIVFALLQTNIYRAEIVLAPAESRQSASPLANQFGGAAALVGIEIGPQESSRISNTIAILQSREFIRRFIDEHNVLIPLFAGTWNTTTRESGIDPTIYDEAGGQWTRKEGKPTDLEAFRKFSALLSIGQDQPSSLIRLSLNWHDPVRAAEWTNQMVADINRDVKAADVEEANNAIRYLRGQLESTQLVEMQRVFYELIESQTRITMLADVRDEYVFQIIDPAVVPDQHVAPRRAVIVVLGTLAGVILAMAIVFLRHAFTPNKVSSDER